MNQKLFYEQPQISVLHIQTEGLMVSFSNNGYGNEIDVIWDN